MTKPMSVRATTATTSSTWGQMTDSASERLLRAEAMQNRPYAPSSAARAATSFLKTSPRSSKEWNSSNDAQAGESSTTSPALACSRATSSADSMLFAVSSWKPAGACCPALLERLGEAGARRAEAHDGARVGMGGRDQVGQVGALVVAAEQHDGTGMRERRQRLERGVDVGGLRIVIAFGAAHGAARLDAMLERAERGERFAHGLVGSAGGQAPPRRRQARCRRCASP